MAHAFHFINDRIVDYPDPLMQLTDRVKLTASFSTIIPFGRTLFPNLIRLTRGGCLLEVRGIVGNCRITKGSR